jgi:hypothetical protein
MPAHQLYRGPSGEQDFVQSLSRPYSGENDVDIGRPGCDPTVNHRSARSTILTVAHIEDVNRRRTHRRQRVRGGCNHQIMAS